MFCFIRWFQTFFDEDCHKYVFIFVKESAIVTYIVHFLWIEIINRYVVWRYKLSFIPAFIVVWTWTVCGAIVTFTLVKYVPYLGIIFGV